MEWPDIGDYDVNRLYYGDNLAILRRYVKDESVDLVYLDPPFQSGRDHNVIFERHDETKAAAQIKAFEDTWRWSVEAEHAYREVVESGDTHTSRALQALRQLLAESDMMAYLCMMAPRLFELRRVLKPTGSIYLHCDPTASHYLKVLLDAIFGHKSYTNEIIWGRTNARSTRGCWPRVHDILLYYRCSGGATFHPQHRIAGLEKLPHTLITGPDGKKYQTYELTAPGATRDGESGRPWRGHDPSIMGRHWANSHETMDECDAAGLIHWPARKGFPRRRAEEPFDPTSRTVVVGDVWLDIDRLNQTAKERLGYPTQKPIALLERIIAASSNEGDVVLDPFCGCGTAVHAAQRLGRNWIGIDLTHLATNLIKHRLSSAFGEEAKFEVIGEPTAIGGARQLAEDDRFQFQCWALGFVGARATDSDKKGPDRGIDGRLYFHEGQRGGETKQVIFSVKSGRVSVRDVRDLRGVIEREKADIGCLITLEEPTGPMQREASAAGLYRSPWAGHQRIQILTIAQLLSGETLDFPVPRFSNRTLRKAVREYKPAAEQIGLPGIVQAVPRHQRQKKASR